MRSEREDKRRNEQERERAKKLKKKELLERELEQMKKWAVSPEEFILASYQINWAVSADLGLLNAFANPVPSPVNLCLRRTTLAKNCPRTPRRRSKLTSTSRNKPTTSTSSSWKKIRTFSRLCNEPLTSLQKNLPIESILYKSSKPALKRFLLVSDSGLISYPLSTLASSLTSNWLRSATLAINCSDGSETLETKK